MFLKQQIDDQLKKAMKDRNEGVVSILRFVRAEIKNKEIELKKDLNDNDIVGIIQKMVKQLKEPIEQFHKGGRQDLVEKASREIKILKSFLPTQMGLSEIENEVRKIITELGIDSLKQMGQVMKIIKEKFSGRIDMKEANRIIQSLLTKQ